MVRAIDCRFVSYEIPMYIIARKHSEVLLKVLEGAAATLITGALARG